MRWLVLPVALVWIVFCLFFGLFMRRLPGPARFVVVVVFIGSFLGLGYGFTEFVINKGPDDWGSMWHAGYPLAAKYGKAASQSYSMKSFDKDGDGSGSGTYHLQFKFDEHEGTILCHYNKATGNFDHDEIVPDR